MTPDFVSSKYTDFNKQVSAPTLPLHSTFEPLERAFPEPESELFEEIQPEPELSQEGTHLEPEPKPSQGACSMTTCLLNQENLQLSHLSRRILVPYSSPQDKRLGKAGGYRTRAECEVVINEAPPLKILEPVRWNFGKGIQFNLESAFF